MKQIIFTTILLFVICLSAYSQANDLVCPAKFSISPKEVLAINQTVKFAVKQSENIGKNLPKYEWEVSGGKIVKGQGTSEIELFVLPNDAGSNMTVSVKIFGLSIDCSVSDIFGVAQIVEGDPYDQFGKINFYDYLARLDALFFEIAANADYKGLVIINFDSQDGKKYQKARLQSIRKHIAFREFDASRITLAISEGQYEERTIFWLASLEAELPIDVKDYTIIKGEKLQQKINELFPKK